MYLVLMVFWSIVGGFLIISALNHSQDASRSGALWTGVFALFLAAFNLVRWYMRKRTQQRGPSDSYANALLKPRKSE